MFTNVHFFKHHFALFCKNHVNIGEHYIFIKMSIYHYIMNKILNKSCSPIRARV
jgi:hypothetical protein